MNDHKPNPTMNNPILQPYLFFNGFFLSLGVATEDEANEVFAALADGGQVVMPLAKTFWSPRFGMVTDRFGLGWMITVTPAT